MRIYKKWSSEDLCFIAENCNKMKDKELAILLMKEMAVKLQWICYAGKDVS